MKVLLHAGKGAVALSQSTDLSPGDLVHVAGTKFTPNVLASAFECNLSPDEPSMSVLPPPLDLVAPLGPAHRQPRPVAVPVGCSGPFVTVQSPWWTSPKGSVGATVQVHRGVTGPPQQGLDDAGHDAGHDAATDAARYPCPPTAQEVAQGGTCAIGIIDSDGNRQFDPVTFASGPPGPVTTIRLSSTGGLVRGQVVSLRATGFAPGTLVVVAECDLADGEPTVAALGSMADIPVGCGNGGASAGPVVVRYATPLPHPFLLPGWNLGVVPSTGAFTASVTVATGPVGPPSTGTDSAGRDGAEDAAAYPCPPTPAELAAGARCAIAVYDIDGDRAVAPITFSGEQPAPAAPSCVSTAPAGGAGEPSSATTPMTTSTAPSAASGPSWPEKSVPLAFNPQVVGSSNDEVYAQTQKVGSPPGTPFLLQSEGLATGAVRTGPSFIVGGLTASGDELWVTGAVQIPSSTAWAAVVCEVDPTSLAVIRQVPLPIAPTSYGDFGDATAPVEGGVLVGFATGVYRIDAATGTVTTVGTVASGEIAGISLSPDSDVLYASVSVDGTATDKYVTGVLYELSYPAGRVIATAPERNAIMAAAVVASATGVWISYRTGMQGETDFLRESDLSRVPLGGPSLGGDGGVFRAGMGVSVFPAAGVLWVVNINAIACVDPDTGQVRAYEPAPPSSGYAILWADAGSDVLDMAGQNALTEFTPPASCFV